VSAIDDEKELASSDAPMTSNEMTSSEMASALSGARGAGRGDRAFSGLALGSGLLVLVILGLIAVTTTVQAWPAIKDEGLSFFTNTDWNPQTGQFGGVALIYGTLLASLIALLIAVPVSLGIALFATQVAPRRMRKPIGLMMDLLAAIPSVVYGLWALLVLVPWLVPPDGSTGVYQRIADSIGSWPVLSWFFGPPVNGPSFMTAGLILACMITPIITSLSREVIATVPRAQREAALALGATRWEMIRGAVIPWSRGGITGAVMLGLGRAMGETIAVALVIGGSVQVTTHVFQPGNTMAAIIANQFGEASGNHRAALIGLGAALFLITIVVNISAQRIISRFDRMSA
jgi:phosphate transport system permease protein